MDKYKILKVTKVEHYCIPVEEFDDDDLKKTVKNLFSHRPINEYHATINSYHVGGASYVKEVEVVDEISMDENNPLKLKDIK